MKKNFLLALVASLCWNTALVAQHNTTEVDRTKYPDYTEKVNPDYSLLPIQGGDRVQSRSRSAAQRPDHVNNAETRYFPPVFNQAGGSCGSASRICYMFSYELAAYRDVDASRPENYYPSHFVWLHTYSPGQGKDEFVTQLGVPSAATYGGQTYSSLFGYQEAENADFGWMQGYDKWFEAMHNRMLRPSNFPVNVGTEEGREAVKNWLWNHNGDESFHAGGICGIGVASGGVWLDIPKTDANDAIGVTGMSYVSQWGTQVDHALTIVGYDDRIEFDLDKDGVYGEADADELGAWIIVNSWGEWENGGFIYCPYAHGVPAFNGDGTIPDNFWTPEIYRVRKDYRPLRTIKLEMDYSRRSEIALSAGVSADLNATSPDKAVPFIHFTYAGDGANGNTNPAPEVPMLGRWADGKLHTEPMEFGYDLTELTEGLDYSQPLKYFFIVDTKEWAQGNGKIHRASIIDYRYDEKGVEIPFAVGDGVEIRNAGEKTIISVIVYGSSYYAPQNAHYLNGALQWQAPMSSGNKVASYNIYGEGALKANVAANKYQYALNGDLLSEYSVSAVYADGNESEAVVIKMPVEAQNPNVGINFNVSGFSIPNVFGTKYEQATIEYWIKPHSLMNWNQSAGQWEKGFMLHANGDGSFTAGWDTSNRLSTSTRLTREQWNHVAIVVDNNKMTVYINGVSQGTVNSSTYSGIGGFGDLVFSANGAGNAQDAEYDEIRIWNTARSSAEIANYKNVEFTGLLFPEALLAYFKGDLLTTADGTAYLRDCVGENHAELLNASYSQTTTGPTLTAPAGGTLSVDINAVEGVVRAGMPVSLTAKYSETVKHLTWTIAGAGIESLSVESPTVVFTQAGTHSVTVVATAANGSTVTATRQMTVAAAPSPDATFTLAKERVAAGERVTFLVNNPVMGYRYAWNMPGADVESATSINAAATYQKQGNYDVTLTVTAVDGSEVTCTKSIAIVEVAPKAAFSISPAVVVKGEMVQLTDRSLYTPTTWLWLLENEKHKYVVKTKNAAVAIDQPGVYTVTLDVTNGIGQSSVTRERALIVCNADSKNGLSFGNAAKVTAQSPFAGDQEAFTVDWWMNAGWPVTFCNGIGDSEQTLLLKTNAEGKMRLYIGGDYVETSADYVVPSEWHHYAVTYYAGAVIFYRDGQQIATKSISRLSLPEMSAFSIGHENAPFSGSIDELRVWRKTLSQEELKGVANAPINDVAQAEDNMQLALYYDFNQSGGDVQDLTSNGHVGVRTNFGPDGDAWALSKGVFCLNFEDNAQDVTAQYLTNYQKPFSYDASQCINNNLPTRTFAIHNWTIDNSHVNGTIITGAHVDMDKAKCMTFTTQWDGFAASLSDHKVFQTITLPAGYYTFSVQYDDRFEGQCDDSYVVAAVGHTLPNKEELYGSLAYKAMKPKGQAGSNAVNFLLKEEASVSLGLLVNMSGSLCMTLQSFTLTRSDITELTPNENVQEDKTELKNLIDGLKTLMESCGDYYMSEAALSAERNGDGYYIWSNAPQSGNEGNVGYLLDNTANTFFHSNWQSGTAPVDGLDHHLTVELGEEAVSLFKFRYQARSGSNLGDYPTTIKVQGSINGTDYDDIATVKPRNAGGGYIKNGAIWTSEVIGNGKAYNYLRFMVIATTSNRNADGHIYWHMAELDLFPRSETPQMNTENTFVPAAFEVALQAVAAGEEAMELVQTLEEYAVTLALLQAAYDELATAIVSGKLPVRLSLDADNPYVYRIGITRDYYTPANTVLQYDLANTGMVDVAAETDNNLQAWYFTKGSADGQIYIHPYVGGGDVLASNNVSDGDGKVKAMPMNSEGYTQEWAIEPVDATNGIYNIIPTSGNTCFSNYNGKGFKMGFYWNANDPGSKFSFTPMEIDGDIWYNTLETYLNVCCTKENVPNGNGLAYYQGGTAYNDARIAAVEVLADMESATGDYKSAYTALRSAKEAMIFHTPEVGKFYRLKSKASGKYMSVDADNDVIQMASEAVVGSVFYLTANNKLLSYKLGTYFNSSSSIGAIGEQNALAIGFTPSESNNGGYFTLKTNDYSAPYISDSGNQVEAAQTYATGNCEWTMEEVESLPVTLGGIGYSTLYAPVALALNKNLKAYIGTIQDDWLIMSEVEDVIPANTAVVLHGEAGSYELALTEEGDAVADNALKGTIETMVAPTNEGTIYTLQANTEDKYVLPVAFIQYYDGKEDKVPNLNGFRAYLPLTVENQAIGIRFEGTTSIENMESTANGQQPKAIYDLFGRRVETITQGGIYIMNGKKVIK